MNPKFNAIVFGIVAIGFGVFLIVLLGSLSTFYLIMPMPLIVLGLALIIWPDSAFARRMTDPSYIMKQRLKNDPEYRRALREALKDEDKG